MPSIHFFSEDTDFVLPESKTIEDWVFRVVHEEGHVLHEINFIFCSDTYLHQINLTYLHHDTFTDIITFDNADKSGRLESDIYISVDRIQENAKQFNADFSDELHRVMIHGVLHLMGYNDKSDQEKKAMRKKEEACLSLRQL